MNIYTQIYQLFNQYIFGGELVVGSFEELVVIFYSMTACLFMVSLPFLVVYWILRFIAGIAGGIK